MRLLLLYNGYVIIDLDRMAIYLPEGIGFHTGPHYIHKLLN